MLVLTSSQLRQHPLSFIQTAESVLTLSWHSLSFAVPDSHLPMKYPPTHPPTLALCFLFFRTWSPLRFFLFSIFLLVSKRFPITVVANSLHIITSWHYTYRSHPLSKVLVFSTASCTFPQHHIPSAPALHSPSVTFPHPVPGSLPGCLNVVSPPHLRHSHLVFASPRRVGQL